MAKVINSMMIREWMIANKVRREQLALDLRVSYVTISNILLGKRPNLTIVALLSQRMGIPEEKLLTLSTRKPKKWSRFNVDD